MKKLNILIVAHEFSPSQGSECAVGWNLVNNLCKYHNITVLFAETNQFNTSEYEGDIYQHTLFHGEINGLTLIPVPQPIITKLYVKINTLIKSDNSAIGFAPLYYAGYKHWQKEVFNIVSRLIKSEKFDLVHQLTSISFREPGYLWKLGIPYVWGPCSGLVRMPSSFYRSLKISEISFELIRRLVNFIQSKFSLRIRKAIQKASMIYSVTIDDYNYFTSKAKCDVKIMLDVGGYGNSFNKSSIKSNNKALKILWVGRLVYTKALDILLNSLSLEPKLKNKVELSIIGDGPLRKQYEKLANKLNLNNIIWLGDVAHENVFEFMQNSDVLIHTSIKEATSAVILESLTYGLPVICHDAFGMATAINEKCGIKIPLSSPQTSINGFSDAIQKLVNNRSLLSALSNGAKIRSQELSWENMAKRISCDYVDIANTLN
ncbi:MAG: glycosyltransferase [Melioribacteraceae bacterium]